MKTCQKCKIEKDESEFQKDKNRKDGLNYVCKQCFKDYYIKNKERQLQRQKIYYQDNCERIKKVHQEYRNNNRFRINMQSKQYYLDNKEKIDEKHLEYWRNNKERLCEAQKKYNEKNKGRINERHKQRYRENIDHYRQYRIANRERILKHVYERKKRLGFNPLNKWFEGSNFHHLIVYKNGDIDYSVGVYIPKELHMSVKHNHKTLLNFDIINDLAISWVIGDSNNKAHFLKQIVDGDVCI